MYASPPLKPAEYRALELVRERRRVADERAAAAGMERRRCTICGGQDHYPADSPLLAPCTGCEDFVRLERVW